MPPLPGANRISVQLATQSNEGRFGLDGDATLVNAYVEVTIQEGKAPFSIYVRPGLKLFAEESTAIGTRGLIEVDNIGYWCASRQLYRVDVVGTPTPLGGIADDGDVIMAKNGRTPNKQIALVTNGGLRFIIENDVISPITDPDLPPPNSVIYLKGRFYFGIDDGRIFASDINDGTSISATAFAEAESDPDGLVRVAKSREQLYALGKETTEVFRVTGNIDNLIAPIQGAEMNIGCAAKHSVQNLDNSLVWVGREKQDKGLAVWQDRSYNPQKISNRGLDLALAAEPDISSLSSFTFSVQGHEFYVLSGTNFTKVYDASTQRWPDFRSQGSNRWRAAHYMALGGKGITGDATGTKLYEIDPDTFDDDGDDLIWVVPTLTTHEFPNSFDVDALYVDVIPGVGLNSTDIHASDPQLAMRISRNGGKTFGNERLKSLGKIGEYDNKVTFRQLGQFGRNGMIAELRASAPVLRGIMGVTADVRGARP